MTVSIKQEGGVQKHLEGLGVDYSLFNTCMELELPHNTIAKRLSQKAGKKIGRRAVGNWAKIWLEERNTVE